MRLYTHLNLAAEPKATKGLRLEVRTRSFIHFRIAFFNFPIFKPSRLHHTTQHQKRNPITRIPSLLYTFKTANKHSSKPITFPTLTFWSSPRPISSSQLHALRHFHLCPINLVVFKGSYSYDGISHLEGGFTLRCLQRLSLPGLATLPWL